MARRRYTPKLKAQVVLEVLAGDKTPAGASYGVNRSRRALERRFVERPGDLADRRRSTSTSVASGISNSCWQKEVEIALLKNFLGGSG